ncbi:MAG: hypothetical protein NTW86_16810 [Candidatus Sumerlaeota bacterium]|nr:hypothetical protein [Candidatus Sumerlaeota bacterium]
MPPPTMFTSSAMSTPSISSTMSTMSTSSTMSTPPNKTVRPPTPLPEFPLAERCAREADLLGYSLSAHPLELLPPEAWAGVTTAERMESLLGKRVTMIGWAIAMKLIRTRKDKRFMKFLSLEDLTGTFEATLFPAAYQRFAHLTIGAGPYRLRGRVENEQGLPSLNVEFLEILKLSGFAEG